MCTNYFRQVNQHLSLEHLVKVTKRLASYSSQVALLVSQVALTRAWATASELHLVQKLTKLWVDNTWKLCAPDASKFGATLEKISKCTTDPLYLFYLADTVYKKVGNYNFLNRAGILLSEYFTMYCSHSTIGVVFNVKLGEYGPITMTW